MRARSLMLALALSLGISGMAMAAEQNPFSDVPKGHWAYQYVDDLRKAGILEGYGDTTYRGSRLTTRYEMAAAVARATAKSDQADAETKAKIEKLQTEFAQELQNLGVRIDGLQKQVDAMPKFGGEIRFRYENTDGSYQSGRYLPCVGGAPYKPYNYSSNTFEERTRLTLTGRISDNWSYHGRFENTQNLHGSGTSDKVDYNNAWVEGKLGTNTVKAGRFDYLPVYGLTADSSMSGAAISGGSKLTYGLYYGHADNPSATGLFSSGKYWDGRQYRDVENIVGLRHPSSGATYTGLELGMKVGQQTNIKAGYSHYNKGLIAQNSYYPVGDRPVAIKPTSDINIFEIGADTKLPSEIGFNVAYAKSDMNLLNKAYKIGVTYKGADPSKPGSYGVDASYQKHELNSTWNSTMEVARNAQGYKIGASYVPAKNMVISVAHIDQKQITPIANSAWAKDGKSKVIRADVTFYF